MIVLLPVLSGTGQRESGLYGLRCSDNGVEVRLTDRLYNCPSHGNGARLRYRQVDEVLQNVLQVSLQIENRIFHFFFYCSDMPISIWGC